MHLTEPLQNPGTHTGLLAPTPSSPNPALTPILEPLQGIREVALKKEKKAHAFIII